MIFKYTSTTKDIIEISLNEDETILDLLGPGTFYVPVIVDNKHYNYIKLRNYTIIDYISPVTVPSSVTPLQARKILRLLGYIDQVNTLITELGPAAQDEWEYATAIDRHHSLIQEIGQELSLSDEEIDNLFIQAATL